jgi:hypothetical protein
MIAQISLRSNFSKIFSHTCPSDPGYLFAMELKDPYPAPPDNGATDKKRKPLAHTTSGLGNGPVGKKLG